MMSQPVYNSDSNVIDSFSSFPIDIDDESYLVPSDLN